MATLSARLTEAQAAYHALLTGSAVEEVRDSNGETIRYTQANRGALAGYISSLERQIAVANGATPATGPMRVWL